MIKIVSFDVGNTLIKSSDKESLRQLIRRESKVEFFDIAYKEHFVTNNIGLDEFCAKALLPKDRLLEIIFYYQTEYLTFL